MAHVKGEGTEALNYYLMAKDIRRSFNEKFYSEAEKTYGCQEMNTLALAFGMVPAIDEAAVVENGRALFELGSGDYEFVVNLD